MAISLTIENPTGIDTVFHKVKRLDLNDFIGRTGVRVAEWSDLTLFTEGNSPLHTEAMEVDFAWIQANYPAFFSLMVQLRDMTEEILVTLPTSKYYGGTLVNDDGTPQN